MARFGPTALRRAAAIVACANNYAPGVVWLLALTFMHLAAGPACRAQRIYPLLGADGSLPTDGLTGKPRPFDINTTVLLERIVSLDEQANGYGAIWWVIFTWPDAKAGATVAASTAAAMRPGGNCSRWCDSGGLPSMGCCDGVWLPHVQLTNIIIYTEDQQPRYRINANASSGTVTWSTRLVGTWYAPLDYRAYPFDHQHLLLELALADSQAPLAGLKWEHVAKLNNTAHTKGPDASGWRVKWGKGKVYDSRTCERMYNATAPRYLPVPGGKGTAGASAALYDSVRLGDRHFSDNHERGTTEPKHCGSYARVYDEGRALYGPVVLVADVMIKRVASYYVLTNLVPVILITLVAFVVFFMPQDALGDRMSVVLTMMLSLTAMQFVFDFPPANYLNALQMVVLVSYILIALACVESLVVNRIATVADALNIKRTCMSKYRGLLARGAFERYLYRELLPKSAGRAHAGPRTAPRPSALKPEPASIAAGGGGRGAQGRPETKHTKAQHTITFGGRPEASHGAGAAWCQYSQANPAFWQHHGPGAVGRANVDDAASAAGDRPQNQEVPYPCVNGHAGIEPSVLDATAAANATHRPADDAAAAIVAVPQFPSGRTHVSFGGIEAHEPTRRVSRTSYNNDDHDSRSLGSTRSRASTVATFVSGAGGIYRRCCSIGFWPSLRAFLSAAAAWVWVKLSAPSRYYRQCKEDPRFARFVAARIDKWSCVACVSAYAVCISVLLWVEVKVGDHKLMLGDAPGNM